METELDVTIDKPTRMLHTNFTIKCDILDDYVFHWKWSYLWHWRKAYHRWQVCRGYDQWAKREADRIRVEIDRAIIESLRVPDHMLGQRGQVKQAITGVLQNEFHT